MKKFILLFLVLTSASSAQFPMLAAWNLERPTGDTAITNLGDSLFLYIAGYGYAGSNGDSVSTWLNMAPKTLGLHDLSQNAGLGQRPTYHDSTYKFLRFDGVNDYISTNYVNKYNWPLTVIAVLRPYKWPGTNTAFWAGDATDRLQSFNQTNMGMFGGGTYQPRPALRPDSLYVIIYEHSSSNAKIMVNGLEYQVWNYPVSVGTSGTANMKKIDIGGYVPLAQYSNYALYELAGYHGIISERRKRQITIDRLSKYGKAIPTLNDSLNIVFEGNSLTYGTGATTTDSIYTEMVLDSLQKGAVRNIRTRNIAVAGQCFTTLCGNNSIVDTLYQVKGAVLPTAKNILVLWAGTVEIGNGFLDSTTTYNAIADYCARRKRDYDQIFVLTVLPMLNNATYNAHMQGLNRMLRAGYSTFADVLVDVQADSRIGDVGDELDTTYYTDTVHMWGEGYRIVASYVYNAILSNP